MAKSILVKELIIAGSELVKLLDAKRVDVKAALWFYRTETDNWRLLIVVPDAETRGPRAVYERLYEVFTQNRESLEPLTFEDIAVQGPNEPLPRLIRSALSTGPGIAEIRFTGNRIDNTYIEDALIYRST